jgi:hypothetical protein
MNQDKQGEPAWLLVLALVLLLFTVLCGGFWALDWWMGRLCW